MAHLTLLGRGLRVIVVMALVAGFVTTVGAAPVSAATPTISISPTSINSGDQVTIDLQGFDPTEDLVALVCPASYAAAAGAHSDAGSNCAVLSLSGSGSASAQVTVAVNDFNTTFSGGAPFRCSALAGGCVIAGANTPDFSTAVNFVSTPITIAAPAQTITARPPVNNGASVAVTTTGFPSGQAGTIGECPGNVTAATVSTCFPLATYPNGIPASTQVVVHDQYQVNGTWSTCGYFQSCALAAWSPDPSPTAFAQIPFSVNGPSLVMTPDTSLVDGQTVTVSSSNGLATPGPASVMECPLNGVAPGVYAACTAPQAFTVDASGSFSVPFVVHKSILGVDGQTTSCGSGCLMVVITSNGQFPYFIVFGFPTITSPSGPFTDGESITTQLVAFPDGSATVAECAASSVGADLASSDCTNPQTTTVVNGSSDSLNYVLHSSFAGTSGTVDCLTTSCVLVGFGAGSVVATSSLPFRTMSLTPSTGLHDGDAITVAAAGLSPNTPYHLAHCVAGTGSVASRCESPLPATVNSDANGNISATVSALQGFKTASPWEHCSDNCTIAVIDSSATVQVERPYTLATPAAAASPATGLHDGDKVTVSGSNLEPTYAGPILLFPTGGWALVECDKAVGTNPTLFDAFIYCGVPKGGGAVNVPGTTSSTPVQVQATLSKILGGTTDCTASPGACVVGLTRWEQNATVTTAFTPISFR